MLMDMFYDCAIIHYKRRVHFHAFMSEVHRSETTYPQSFYPWFNVWFLFLLEIHEIKMNSYSDKTTRFDPIPPVAEDIVENAWLLCFDEFQVKITTSLNEKHM